MFRSRFSASVESFSSSVSSSTSTSEVCECLEYEQTYRAVRRPSIFRRSFPSFGKPQVPAAPRHYALCSPVVLQKQNTQMTSMGYSKLFNIGYLSATGALQFSD